MSYGTDDDEQQGGGLGAMIGQLPAILWQRRWFIVIPTLLGLIAASAAAVLLPTTYQSSAVLLVQAPSLPEDVIGAGSTTEIDRRIEAIRQQIISRPELIEMIEANQLYVEERASKPLSTLVENMRDSITLVPEKIDLSAARDRTIAVRLSFEYKDPTKAQAVAQQLMESVVELNATTNTSQRLQTVQFLEEQEANLQRQIGEAEDQIASLNARYGGVLAASNGTVISTSGMSYDLQIAAIENENASLREQRRNMETASARAPTVVQAEQQLAAARAVYAESHPDVAIARQRLAEAKALAAQQIEALPTESIDRQIAYNNEQIATLQAAKNRETAQVSQVLENRARAPVIQQEVAQLQQGLQALYRQLDSISGRLLAARAGARADEEQMGERLLVVDPPVVPDSPASPNRPLIVALGLAGGLGLGLAMALAIEMIFHPVRSPAAIAAVTGARPLAMVPMISARADRSRGAGRKRGWPWGRSRKRRLARASAGELGDD